MVSTRHACNLLLALSCLASSAHAQGIIISAAGPVNRSMGGAAVAAPIDSMGAMYWNPASISGMAQSEMAFGVDLIWANHSMSSSVGGGSGRTKGTAGITPVPNIGWVQRIEGTNLTMGLGINAAAGFKTNLPVDPTNPVLAPPPAGLGRVSAEAQFLQIAPALSVALTEKVSFAAGPVITTGTLSLEPFVFDSANPNGQYSPGQSTRNHWGLGGQVGVYYVHSEELRFGASVKTPAWMETFEYYSQDENGAPRTLYADFDLPMIVSAGTSYLGIENWLLAADLRFFDYANADGFGDPATFDATGELAGLDWSSILSVALGAQRTLSDRLDVRFGYTFNQNPISDSRSFFATAAPLFYQHMLSTGATFKPHKDLSVNLAYSYLPEISRTGPVILPGIGAVPGSSITNTLDVHALSFGITLRH